MYSSDNNTYVKWGRKKIDVDPTTFKVLHSKLARAGNAILFRDKPIDCDAASFEVLNEGYARDKHHAYEILATKLKPIKRVDPASFIALSPTYAKDSKAAFFRGKRILRCDVESFRAIHPVFAVDKDCVYFTNDASKPTQEPLDLDHISIRVQGQYDEVNPPSVVMTSGDWVYYRARTYGWVNVLGADTDSFAVINDHYQKDNSSVYYHGQVIEGIDSNKAELLGHNVIRTEEGLWAGMMRIDQPVEASLINPETGLQEKIQIAFGRDLAPIGDEYYQDKQGVWKIEAPYYAKKDHPVVITRQRPIELSDNSVDEALNIAYSQLFRIMGRAFKQMPLVLDFANQDHLSQIKVVDTLPEFTLRRQGRQVAVFVDDEVVSFAQISALMTHASGFWSKHYGRRDALNVYPMVGYMGSDPDRAYIFVAEKIGSELLDLAQALFDAGEEDEARIIAHMVLYRLDEDTRKKLLGKAIATLAQEGTYVERHSDFTQTTNAAVGKYIIQSGYLDDDNFRVRYEMLRVLCGCFANSMNLKPLLTKVIPEIVRRLDDEPIEFIREMMLNVIEMALVKAYVRSELNHEHYYHLIEPFIRTQIKHRVNMDYNRARLVEALWAQNLDEEAELERSSLLADRDDQWYAPPLYKNRIYWRNYRLWLMAGKIRAAYREPLSREHLEARLQELEAEVKSLYDYFGRPGNWSDYDQPLADNEPRGQFGAKEPWDDFRELRRDLDRLRRVITE